MTLHLDDAEVRRLLRLEPLIAGVREALIDLSAGRVVQPLRTVMEIASEQGLLFVKPVLSRGILAAKLITQFPRNAERSLPTMLATIVLMDPGTGRTLAVMDGTWITALRTAAVSAAAATALRPKTPRSWRCWAAAPWPAPTRSLCARSGRFRKSGSGAAIPSMSRAVPLMLKEFQRALRKKRCEAPISCAPSPPRASPC